MYHYNYILQIILNQRLYIITNTAYINTCSNSVAVYKSAHNHEKNWKG